MTTTTHSTRKKLRVGSALQALALLGAGFTISAALTAPASAQDFQNVTASGRVQGTNGQAIAGATVSITSNAQGFTRTATTGSDGAYRIPQVPTGTYTFSVSADGFDTFSDANVELSRQGAGNAFTLAPAGAVAGDGDIVVTAGRIQVADFEQTTTGASINVSDLANRVPVARDITSVILLSPGTSMGDSAFGNLPSISGSSVAENVYFVNGLNITNFRNFLGANSVPFEFYDTVDIKNGGYPAEFGRATGGVVNATTKSGTNEFHAGTVVTWEPSGMRSKAPNTRSADNDADFDQDLRADFYVSGPIIKDHLFFYGLYESRNVQSGYGSLTSGIYTKTRTTSPFFAGKVDAVITDGQRLEFTYFRTTGRTKYVDSLYDSDTNKVGAYQSDFIGEYGGDNYVGRYTGSFTDWLTVSAAYGKSKNRDNSTASLPDLPLVIDYRTNSSGQSLAQATSSYFIENHEDEREFYRGDVDLYFNLLGSHHIRFGLDHENLYTFGGTHYTSGSYYEIFPSATGGPATVERRTFVNGGGFTSENEAYYIEDSWSLLNNRLTLQLGLRNDKFQNNSIEGKAFYKSGNQWGPRLGFTFDPLGDGRTKLYGSFGRTFLPIAANTNIRAAGSEYDVTDVFLFNGLGADNVPILGAPVNDYSTCIRTSDSNCQIAANGSVTPTTNTVAKNLKPQSMDEYILGGEQRLGDHLKVGMFATYRKLNRALEDVAVDQAALAYCEANGLPMTTADGDGCAQLYTGFSQYVLVNPGEDATVTLFDVGGEAGPTVDLTAADLGFPKAKRKYEAVTFTVDREFDGVWSLSGSYTYSKTIGNYEGAVKSDVGQSDAGATQDFDQPGLVPGAYGYLPGDHRHNFKLYGSYQMFDWLQLGGSFQALAPRHFGCIGTVPRSPGATASPDFVHVPGEDPFAFAYGAAGNYCRFAGGQVSQENPVVLVPRGTAFKSDWLTSLDLTAAFKLPTDAFEGVIRFDVFNAFNSKAKIDFDEFGSLDALTTVRGPSPGIDPETGNPIPGPVLSYEQNATPDTYRNVLSFQQPRYVRVQLQMRF